MIEIIEAIILIPTSILFVLILIQYGTLVFGKRYSPKPGSLPSISVLIPAHNEGRYIKQTIDSVLGSGYPGRMEVIVADDGSADNTPEILKQYSGNRKVRAIRTPHIGKSRAMNRMMDIARNDIIITIDGDTVIEKDSLQKLVAPFSEKETAATTGSMKIANHNRHVITWFQKLEYFGFSLFNEMCQRVNGVYCTAGTLSAFRRSVMKGLGGFSDSVLLEDKDLGLRLTSEGHKIRYVPGAVAYTNAPEGLRHLLKQRFRWSRGGIQIIKKHRQFYGSRKFPGIGFFSLPVMSYWYFHSAIIVLIFLQVFIGYGNNFLSSGVVMSPEAAQYFLFWFSIFGAVNLTINTLAGVWPATPLNVLNILIVLLTYALMIYSIRWMGEKPGIRDVIAIIFMFPYWIVVMAVNVASNIEWPVKRSLNRWDKS